eukprot:4086866-Amphidinium_carterae.1
MASHGCQKMQHPFSFSNQGQTRTQSNHSVVAELDGTQPHINTTKISPGLPSSQEVAEVN